MARDRLLVPFLAALVLIAGAYALALPGPFHFDDHATVAVDPGAQSIGGWWVDAAHHVRPLTKLTFVFSHALGDWIGHVPMGHRAINLLIHLLAVSALYAVGRQMARTCLPAAMAQDGAAIALVAALLVGIHPLATEAVSYINGRSMALGTLLAAASLWAYMRWRTGGGAPWCALAMAACAGAVLARETAIVTPLLWLLWELARRDGIGTAWSRPRLLELSRHAALALAIIAGIALWMLVHDRYAPLLEVSRRIAASGIAEPSFTLALQYFGSALLLLRYPTIDPDVLPARMALAERLTILFVLAAALVAAWRLRHSRPHLLLSALWIAAWLAPLYAIPVRYDAVAERHFYPAIWGAAFAAAVEAARWADHSTRARRACVAGGAIACLVLSAVTLTRVADYRTEVALWEAASRSSPTKVRVLNNLGFAYMESGRWDEALAVLGRAARLDPDDAQVQDNLLLAEQRELGPVRWVRPPE